MRTVRVSSLIWMRPALRPSRPPQGVPTCISEAKSEDFEAFLNGILARSRSMI